MAKIYKKSQVTYVARGAEKSVAPSEVEAVALQEIDLVGASQSLEMLQSIESGEGDGQGYEDGFQKGMSDATAQLSAAIQRFELLLERIPKEVRHMAEHNDEEITTIALVAAARVVGEHILDRNRSIKSIQATIQAIRAEEVVCLHIAQHDFAFMQEHGLDFEDKRILRVVPSAHVELGGCIVDAAMGSIDARFESQLSKIKESIKGILSK